MIDRTSVLLAVMASMAIAGFTSQMDFLAGLPKALTVGLVAATAFVVIRSAMSRMLA